MNESLGAGTHLHMGRSFALAMLVTSLGCTPTQSAPPQAPAPAAPTPVQVAEMPPMTNAEVERARAACASELPTALEVAPGSAKLAIAFDRGQGDAMTITECVAFSLDGHSWHHARLDPETPQTIPIFDGSVAAGPHTMRTFVAMRVRLPFCPYCYVHAYKMTVTNLHVVRARDDVPLGVRVELFMKGGPTTPIEERPAIRIFENGIERT